MDTPDIIPSSQPAAKAEPLAFTDNMHPRMRLSISIICAGVILAMLFAVGLKLSPGTSARAAVQSQAEIQVNQMDALINAGIVTARADVDYFYAPDTISITAEGVILTPASLKYYTRSAQGKITIFDIPYGDIKSIKQVVQSSAAIDAEYQIIGRTAYQHIYFALSPKDGKHAEFIDVLKSRSVGKTARL